MLAVMVCPHATTVEAGAASAGTATTHPPNVNNDADNTVRKLTRIVTDPPSSAESGRDRSQEMFYCMTPGGAIAIVGQVSM
jgi:hypothetical protein